MGGVFVDSRSWQARLTVPVLLLSSAGIFRFCPLIFSRFCAKFSGSRLEWSPPREISWKREGERKKDRRPRIYSDGQNGLAQKFDEMKILDRRVTFIHGRHMCSRTSLTMCYCSVCTSCVIMLKAARTCVIHARILCGGFEYPHFGWPLLYSKSIVVRRAPLCSRVPYRM